jgi:drug/metabolite transporter (DMT)-like permease
MICTTVAGFFASSAISGLLQDKKNLPTGEDVDGRCEELTSIEHGWYHKQVMPPVLSDHRLSPLPSKNHYDPHPMTPPSPTRSRAMVLAAAILFSTGGAAVKATSLTAWQVASFRSAVAVIAIFVLLPAARSGWNRRTWLVGFAYAATMICFVFANKLTTAANAIFLQGTAPLWVLLLSPWLLAERIDRRQLGFMSVMALGMACFFVGSQPVSTTAPDPIAGNILGAATGLSYALLIIGLRWLGRGGDNAGATIGAVCCGNLLAALAALPMALPVGAVSTIDWAAVLFLGIFQIGIAYAFLVRGIGRVPAFEASLILLAEPVLSPFWAWLAHGETPTVWAAAGGAIILGATATMALTSRPTPRGRMKNEQ